MGTGADTVEAILSAAGPGASARKMFGEHALYREGKVAALICGDRLFLKPTAAGRALLPDAEEAPPYPGAKPHLVVPEELWDEPGLLPALLAATAEALPAPKPKSGLKSGPRRA